MSHWICVVLPADMAAGVTRELACACRHTKLSSVLERTGSFS
jgi:hypothetical protein